jgi:lipopolysaccharide transport system permease protein
MYLPCVGFFLCHYRWIAALQYEYLDTTMTRQSVFDLIGQIWRERRLLVNTVKVDINTQYAGTVLGLAWIALGPILLLCLYATIYAVIFRVRVPNFTVEEYVLNVFSGLVPFLAFAQALSASSGVIRRDKKLFFSNFPVGFIPIKAVIGAYMILGVGTVLVICGDFLVSEPSWTLLLVPVVAVFQILFSIGLGMFIALIALVFKDIEFLIQYVVIALLVVTPIAYTPDMIPTTLAPLLYGNPLYYFVTSNQHLILLNTLPPLHIMLIGGTLSLGTFFCGTWFFLNAKQAVNDLI